MRLLILGGTTEASALARALPASPTSRRSCRSPGAPKSRAARRSRSASAASAASRDWRTISRAERIDALIDATHPFAEQNVGATPSPPARAARRRSCLHPPGLDARAGDRWTEVDDDARRRSSARARRRARIPDARAPAARRLRAAPQHRYLVRAIDGRRRSTPCPIASSILARGPFASTDEVALMRDEGDRDSGHQEQRRRARPTPRSRRRARSAFQW